MPGRNPRRICARNVPLQKSALPHLDNAAWLRYLLSNRLTSRGFEGEQRDIQEIRWAFTRGRCGRAVLRHCTRDLVCNGTKKCAHEHTGPAESIRPSLRNGLTAYGALSPETNSFCLRHRRIDGFANPVGSAKTSADLTPATGARTTRFCRTQLPSPNHPTSHLRPAEVLAEAFKRRSSTRCRSLTENRPANMPARPTLPRPPHPIPTFRDDRDTPLVEGMRCGRYGTDLGETGRGIFLGAGAGRGKSD